MKPQQQKHMKIIENDSFTADLELLFYAESDEKQILRDKLSAILRNQYYESAIDLGCGPGHVSNVLQQHARKLTLLEIIPSYCVELQSKYPQATVINQSVLDFEFTQSYDVILLSHVLYYIAPEVWESLLQKLYNNLTVGGKLIVIHSPCHRLHSIFNDISSTHSNIAYMDEPSIERMMQGIGPHDKDYYLSVSYFNEAPTAEFAWEFVSSFFGLNDDLDPDDYQTETNQLLNLFTTRNKKLALEFQSDIYVWERCKAP